MSGLSFFIYGSMCEGFVHHAKFEDMISITNPGCIMASAYRLKVGFPVLIENKIDSKLDKVSGDLVKMKTSLTNDFLLSIMDEFHGFNQFDEVKSLYHRREIDVYLNNDQIEKSYCYFLNPKKLPTDAQPIVNGDWKTSLALEPSLTEKLTQKQISYIQRLGATSGREIVPIDLPLYRELMSLELIVDKGRRLALSKFGKEVFRYLS